METGIVSINQHENNKKKYEDFLNRKRKSRWDNTPRTNLRRGGYIPRMYRWGNNFEKSFTPLPFPSIPENLTVTQFEILIRRTRLEDVSRRILGHDWETEDPDLRSPSPDPIYDNRTHQRINTYEVRTREAYIKEKNALIEELLEMDPTFVPPSDWQPPKKTAKLYFPLKSEVNLIAMILGPRGATQKDLEKKTGCKMSIRGKGSNWNSTFDLSDPNEPIHVFLQADNENTLRKGISIIEPILDPKSLEHMQFKQQQRNQVANLYGFAKEHGCENCGDNSHKTWACPMK